MLLAVILAGQFMANLDVSVVNVALPTLRADLHVSDAGLQLVAAGYILTFAVLLITGARLGGLIGHRRAFLLGLAGFTLTSAACGVAPQVGTLIAFRFLQGASAALMTPQVMSLIQRNFAGPARARALGYYGAVLAGGVVVGQAAGGLLVSADLFDTGWRAVFLVNVPIGLLLLVTAPRILPRDEELHGPSLDVPGLLVLSATVLLFVLPLVLGHDLGWPAWTFVALAASVVLAVVFVAVERHVSAAGGRPLISGRVLRAPGMAAAAGTLVLAPSTWGAFLFTTTLHLQGGLEMSPLRSGIAFIPCVAAFGLTSTSWQRLPAAWHRPLIPIGLAFAAASYLLLGPTAGGGASYEVATALIGLGLGVLSTTISVALAHVPVEDASDASGLLLTLMQLGQVIGLATIGTLFLTVVDDGGSTRHAEHDISWALSAVALLAAASAAFLTRGTARQPAVGGRFLAEAPLSRGAVFGHRLGADDVEKPEPVGGVAPGGGGVGDDAQVSAGSGEHVAVEGEHADSGVVDGLGDRLVDADDSGVPHLREGEADVPQLFDQST